MTSEPILLSGCAPRPLSGYLKALGVFRLVATQADVAARAWWEGERFHLATSLSSDELLTFLLHECRPTPVVSPWNAGSGFYYREGKTSATDPITGKRVKTGIRNQSTEATRALDAILGSTTARLGPYRLAIHAAKEQLVALRYDSAPADRDKLALIQELRSRMPDAALEWLDAAVTVTERDVAFPPLLGSGGNDGNLDFSTTLVQRLLALIDPETGGPMAGSDSLLEASLFGAVARMEGDLAISQFAPAAIGAPNSTTGFSGAVSGSAWDTILALEGTLMMATAIVRRIAARDNAASFPFMISRRGVLGAGAGGIAPADENARGEFWAPIWGRPATFAEVSALFREGRVVVGKLTASDALDFAQAIARLGVDRGIGHFERYAFEQRSGNMYIGVALDRRPVRSNSNASLIADLERENWLGRVRGAVRSKGVPASVLALGRDLDEALFRLAADESPEAVQEALLALGTLALETGRRPKLCEAFPPPSLSSRWLDAANDGSPAFEIARAMATLDATAPGSDSSVRFQMPFRRHVAPVQPAEVRGRRDQWAHSTTEAESLVVWTARDVLADMAAVLERRLVEGERRDFMRGGADGRRAGQPLAGWGASLEAIGALVSGELDAQLDRIAMLAAGLAWVSMRSERPSPLRSRTGLPGTSAVAGVVAEAADDDAAPAADAEDGTSAVEDTSTPGERTRVGELAFAALKPLFDPRGVAIPRAWRPGLRHGYGREDRRERRQVNPLPLLRLIRANRVDDSLRMAMRMARAADLSVHFAETAGASARVSRQSNANARLAAALAVPLTDSAIEALANRAYPPRTEDQEEPSEP